MTKRSVITVVASAALLMTAIPAATLAQDDPDATPEGVLWNLTIIGGEAGTEVPADVEATLYMEDGEANGSTGCNSFSGSYELEGESLTFDENFAVTMAFCEGAAGEVEQAYMAALPTVAGWGIDSNELSLLDGGQGVALVYEASSPTVDLTEADIETLILELERLHARINNTRQDMRQLNVDSLRERVVSNEAVLEEVSRVVQQQNVPGLRDRVIANEAVLDELSERFVNVRKRVRDLEERVDAIEAALELQVQPLE